MGSSTNNFDNLTGFSCFWKIENFTKCKLNKTLQIKSHIFKVEMLKSNFFLKCQKEKNFLCVYIFKDGNSEDCTLEFSITVLTSTGWLPIECTYLNTFKSNHSGCGRSILEWDVMFKYSEYFLPNESLTIFCRMWNDDTKFQTVQYYLPSYMLHAYGVQLSCIQKFTNLHPCAFVKTSEIKKVKDESTQTDTSTYANTFNEKCDLVHLFKEKGFRFVTLRTARKDFIVHEAIICARSPVFQAMFDLNMKENERRLVDIDDIDTETLTLLLRFLHLEPLGDMKWETAAKLYYAADKYQIPQLKEECASYLKHKIANHNVCEMFVLSDLHQDKELKQYAQEYFYKHSKEVLLLKEWNDLLLNKTELAAEILRGLALRL